MVKQISKIVYYLLQAVNGYPMEPSPSAVAAVEYALRRLCSWLVHGDTFILFPVCALSDPVLNCCSVLFPPERRRCFMAWP